MQSSFTAPDNVFCELTSLGMITVGNEEATTYLQGKVTNDMEALTPNRAQIGCHCDFKGKTWNIFYALKSADQYQLICHKESLTPSMTELKKYSVFSKVDMQDDSQQWQFFGLAGDKAEQAIEQLFGDLPSQNLAVVSHQQGKAMRLDSPRARYLVIANQKLSKQLTETLHDVSVDENVWEALDIAAGIANIQTATLLEFVPQMMNLQALGAINFNKGCYMGQEVVARTKYLGKNKRAAFVLRSDDPSALSAGDTLEVQMGENWRRSGTVLRSAAFGNQTWILAVLPNDTESEQIFRAKQNPQQTFCVEPLPYELDS